MVDVYILMFTAPSDC